MAYNILYLIANDYSKLYLDTHKGRYIHTGLNLLKACIKYRRILLPHRSRTHIIKVSNAAILHIIIKGVFSFCSFETMNALLN